MQYSSTDRRSSTYPTLVDVLRDRATLQPEQIGYSFLLNGEKEVCITYGELDRRARLVASLLQSKGAFGERVLLLYPPGLDYLVAFCGCLYAGAIAVPCYPPRLNRPDSRLQGIVVDAQASIALTTSDILAALEKRLVHIPQLKSLQWLNTDTLADVLEETWRDPLVKSDSPAFIQYTSGSTARPRGVTLTHGNLLHNLTLIRSCFELSPASRAVIWLPPYHDMGLIGGILGPLHSGFPVLLMSPFALLQNPLAWLQAISSFRATISGGPNFAYDLCLSKITPEQRSTLDLSCWDVAFSGAEPVRPATIARFTEAFKPCGFRLQAFYPCYGLAEATLIVSGGAKAREPITRTFLASALEEHRVVPTPHGQEGVRTLVGCGHVLPDEQIVIVQPNTCERCQPGCVGEIWVSGPSVAQGYWGRAEETRITFKAHLANDGIGPFLRTGDLGFLDDGELFITGRLKDLIIVRGRNHYPQDIELTVEHCHSALRQGCGVAFSVEVLGEERLVIVQEVKHSCRDLDIEQIARTIRQVVVEAHDLQVYAVVLIKPGSMRKTSSGKLQRHLCRAEFLAGELSIVAESILDPSNLPQNTEAPTRSTLLSDALLAMESQQRQRFLERQLQQQTANLLGIPPAYISLDQPLTALGLDSLMTTQLQHSLEASWGFVLPADNLPDLTLAQLAAQLADELVVPKSRRPEEQIMPISRSGELALSLAQERIWFLDRLEPGNPAYNLSVAVRLRGHLVVHALKRSLDEMVRRHETLRASFGEVDGRPIQVISPNVVLRLAMVDLQEVANSDQEAEVTRLIADEALQPFTLAQAPLVRATLLHLNAQDHVFLVTMHHIISDGWSLGVFNHELTSLYKAFSEGRTSPLSEHAIQYVDYANWQRRWLQGPVLETQLAYWKRQLSGELPMLELPTKGPRPPIRTWRGTRQSRMLPESLVHALKALAQREGSTLFTVLLAAFKIILQRYAELDDVIVGSPVAGRHRREVASLIGFFLNTLVLRTDLSGNPTFVELLRRVTDVTRGALANQDVPFERILEELQPERDLSRTPLFQVFFNMLNFPNREIELLGLTAEVISSPQAGTLFDLTLYVEEEPAGIRLDLVYNADLFGKPQVVETLAQFHYLLVQIAENPQTEIGNYSLVTETAVEVLPNPVETLNADWQGAVHTLFARQARQDPDQLALVDKEGDISYGELDARSNQLANYLLESGIKFGDLVAIYGHRSAALVRAVLGTLKAGAAFIILDPAYPATRLISFLQAAQPRGWVQLKAAGDLPRALEQYVTSRSWPCLQLGPCTGPRADRFLEEYSAVDPEIMIGPNDLALVVFTSGSTGVPKGILGRHGPLSHFLPWQKRAFDLRCSDRYSMLSGLSHDPLQRDIFTSLAMGATLCIPDPDQIGTPGWLPKWMRREGITVAHVTPAMLKLVTAAVSKDGGCQELLPSLRFVFTVGDVLTRQDIVTLRTLAPRVMCVCLYGSTETQRAVGHYVLDDIRAAGRQTIPLGKGIPDVQLLVLNASRHLTGIGEIGEIHVRSPHLAMGYLDDDSLTRERFIINPFTKISQDRLYKTGDLGRYCADGNVEFRGRVDNQVKIRGFRVELGEIEAMLGQYPGVRETVALVRENEPGNKRLVAYVVPSQGVQPQLSDLRRFLKARLPEYMVPSDLVLLEKLPLTPNRKVDRRALPAPEKTRAGLEDFVPPRTSTEQVLAKIWEAVLGHEEIGVNDNFFDLGGHSLLVARVMARVGEVFPVELSYRSLFEAPTVAGLAEIIEAALQVQNPLSSLPLRPASRDAELCLSFAQQRLWFLDQLNPMTPLYSVFFAARLAGPLDLSALCQSFRFVVGRHEILRTTFKAVEGRPVQIIAPDMSIDLPYIDLRELAGDEQEREVELRMKEVAGRPFDLAHGPLVRTTLLRLAEEEHILLLNMHHITTDNWSMGIFIQEMAAAYEAFSIARCPSLPNLPVQYADYAHWQQESFQGERLESQLRYWKHQLGGAPRLLELPTDHRRPPVQTFHGARKYLRLSRALAEALQALSRYEGATLFMILLAAFKTLLFRYSGQEDISIGTPIANRNRVEIEGLIGFFANTLVLRTNLSGNPSFREVLRRVRQGALEAYAHQDLPFQKLVEELQPERDQSYNPLFQVMFILQTAPVSFTFPNLTFTLLDSSNQTAKFDMMLELRESPEGLSGWLEYNTDLFEEATISRMISHFEALLDAIVANPDQRIADLPMLTAEERHLLLDRWNDTLAEYPKDSCIHQIFEAQAERTPESVALIFGEETVTYGELDARANQLARYLQRRGVGPEACVAIHLERSVEMFVSVLGTLKAGGAYVPLDPMYPLDRLVLMIQDARPQVLITQTELAEALTKDMIEVIYLGTDWESIATEDTHNLDIEISPDNAAYIIYTSGSTGVPKGVIGTHRGIVNRLAWMWQKYPFAVSDVCCLRTSFNFVDAVCETFGPLLKGVPAVIITDEMAKDVQQLVLVLAQNRITRILVVPLLLALVLDLCHERIEQTLPDLRLWVTSGETICTDLAERFRRSAPSSRLVNLYGSSEIAADVTCFEIPAEDGGATVPIGRPIWNTRIYILDRHLQPVPIGVSGELCVGGEGLARGYLNRQGLTAERFMPDRLGNRPGQRLYRTGDMARYRADGTIEFQGRIDNQVKIRGCRVELGEVEAVLQAHPSVRSTAVIALDDAMGSKYLAAFLVLQDGQSPTTDELIRYLNTKLPDHMVPSIFEPLDALPLTPNGKVDRLALPDPHAFIDMNTEYLAPRNEVERRLVCIWKEVLGCPEEIGIDNAFFSLGGHSLNATQALSRMNQEFHVVISLGEFFDAPTVRQMAIAIIGKQVEEISAQVGDHELMRIISELDNPSDDQVSSVPLIGGEEA